MAERRSPGGPSRFKQSDVTRAIRGAIGGGMRVGRIEIDIHGRIVILAEQSMRAGMNNPWDEELK